MKIFKIFGWLLIVFCLVVVIGLRVKGIHLTEGELLINYWKDWLSVFIGFCLGIFLVCNPQNLP